LTETTHYTVSATNRDYSSGGVVTTTTAYAAPNKITILRNVPLTQDSDFVEGMPTLYETFESGLDKLTRITQQLQELIARTVLLPRSSPTSGLALPAPVAGSYLRWNAALTALENAGGAPSVDPSYVTAILTGDSTITYSGGNSIKCFIDPGGADRNYDPVAGFPAGFELTLVNTGEELLTFDSATLNQAIAPGQAGIFTFDGTIWR
jgi:hypothetical protein